MNVLIIILVSLILLFIIVHLHRSKRAKNKFVYVVQNNCTGCRQCLKRCRRKVLQITNDETGKYITVKNPQKCTACGNCLAVCKFNALELLNRAQPE